MKATEIASRLGLSVRGLETVEVTSASAPQSSREGSAVWIRSFSSELQEAIRSAKGSLIVHPPAPDVPAQDLLQGLASTNALIEASNPRLAFARLLDLCFSSEEAQVPEGIDPSAWIHPSAVCGQGVTVGPNCFIGQGVEIGDDSILHPNVIVHSKTRVGRRCVMNAGVVLGTRGFGFVQDKDGSFTHFPQIGRVVIEDDVEIQANTTVARPGLGETIIQRGAKIDCLCHIGHNANVGPNSIITACVELGAGVVVEEGAWIGPNSCSLEGVTFGRASMTGIGAVVVRDVEPESIVAGSPAESTRDLKLKRAAIKSLLNRDGN